MTNHRHLSTSSTNIQTFAEQMLVDRIFMGDYQEKRYVSKLNAYRDVIILNKNEQMLADDMRKVKHKILEKNLNTWYGFNEPNDADAIAADVFCIWTRLDDPNKPSQEATSVVFGEYLFQIEGLRFDVSTVEICVKVLRPIVSTSSMSGVSTISSFAQQAIEFDTQRIQQYVQDNITDVDWIMLFNQWKTSINQRAYRFASTEITWTNFIQCIHLIGWFCIAVAKLSVKFVIYIGEFSLRLISELTKLMKAMSPIAMAVISLLSKMIGGLYILIAMIWKDLFYGDSPQNRKNGPANRNNFRFTGRPAITYRDDPRPFLQNSYGRRSTTTSSRFNSNT
ncbi:uncharacterized protein LOC116345283 [Contarinia nasturtii]|uniref:uncharacterized protein LOC116345283 n=1 Tax=Contarinia nasturtii TaxID=265458 RepID=UPI0012D4358A|nr:uncharacterized protein LOC116345283 [Contarinia nasturtii]